jgi:opacity protein-like surface antigen
MKKIVLVSAIVLAFALGAVAQDSPRFETFMGFTYQRFNPGPTNIPSFSANGGSGQFVVNLNKWAGFLTDIGATHNGNIGGNHLDTTMVNFLFGPRISIRTSRLKPYVQLLFGGVHAGTSEGITLAYPAQLAGTPTQPIYIPGYGNVIAGQTVTLRAVASQTSFAMTVGGGLDIKISKGVSFRPIQLEYYMTRMQNLRTLNDNNQNSLRYSTGFNFTFGAQ